MTWMVLHNQAAVHLTGGHMNFRRSSVLLLLCSCAASQTVVSERNFLMQNKFVQVVTNTVSPSKLEETSRSRNIVPGVVHQGWTQLAGSGLDSSGACPGPPYDNSIYDGSTAWMSAQGCSAVVDAWGGGVLRTSSNEMVLWGGGHSDYGGNEIYTVSFTQSPAKYKRIFGPSLPGVGICSAGASCARGGCAGLPVSGSGNNCAEGTVAPNSRHTYGGMTYIPANSDASGKNHEEMFVIGGSL